MNSRYEDVSYSCKLPLPSSSLPEPEGIHREQGGGDRTGEENFKMHENVRREKKESIKKSQKGWNPNPRNSADLAELPRMAVASDTHVGSRGLGCPL